MTNDPARPLRRAVGLAALIAAGEAVFALPFVVARVFRPTLLDVFGITNFQLGAAMSLYGLVAMAAYFAGGPLADRFSARRLMTAALLATAAGGTVYASIPSIGVLSVLFAYWGLTTIFLFWAALIRATREWGGSRAQGRAYGFLDGGRGLLAALVASATVAVFAMLLPSNVEAATLAERTVAFRRIIWIFTGITVAAALFVWLAVPDASPARDVESSSADPTPNLLTGLRRVLRIPAVWLQAVIVVCAYVGYKATDDFSLYAFDAFGYDDVEAAQLGTISFWVRPFAAVAAGFVGDRIASSRAIVGSFLILVAGSLVIASGLLTPGAHVALIGTVVGTSVGIYALRGIYFALFEEAHIPLAVTGSAVGVVSVIGYTPDVFMGPLMGFLIDRSPGAAGHQHVFLVVALFGVVGLASTILFQRITRSSGETPEASAVGA